MKKKNYSFEEKLAYYKKQRSSPRAIGFLDGVDYARTHQAKKELYDSLDFKGSDLQRGFYAGIKAYNDKYKKGR